MSSSAGSMKRSGNKAHVTPLADAPVLIDKAIEKVQSLAFAKIAQKVQAQAGSARSSASARHANSETLPVEAKPLPSSGVQDTTQAETKKNTEPEPDQPAEIKSEAVSSSITGATSTAEVEEPPWQEFQKATMKNAPLPSGSSKQEDPQKLADKALKKMEKSMKAWEDEMRQASAMNFVMVHDSDNNVLEGGFLETEVAFHADAVEVTEKHEDILRRVAATVRMRDKLRLQLIGCGIELDGPAITINRVCNVLQFFKDDGIPCHAVHAIRSSDRCMTLGMKPKQGRYVLCRLHMNFDMELCGHLLGTLLSTNSKTKNIAAWLKSNFEIVTY
jgi:hypothetical protein